MVNALDNFAHSIRQMALRTLPGLGSLHFDTDEA
jgi:hypothetical protein